MQGSFIELISQGAELGAAACHYPQVAIAAVLCATLINFFS